MLTLPSGGLFYGLMVLPFNGRLLQMAQRLGELPDDKQRAKGLFRWSILYLFGICLLLLLARTTMAADFSNQLISLLTLPPASAF